MQKNTRSRKPQHRAQVAITGKLLVMEPPAPDPQAVIPESIPPRLITVGVQYDAPVEDSVNSSVPSSCSSSSCSSPSAPTPHVNGEVSPLKRAAKTSLDNSVFDSPDQTLLPHPLQPSIVSAKPSGMEDSVTTTEEYDMADGLGKPTASSTASSDSLNSNPVVGNDVHAIKAKALPLNNVELGDRVSVDLADMAITATSNGDDAMARGVSEASDSGISRSCCSDVPEKDSESGASDKFESSSVFEPVPQAVAPPDEGIELQTRDPLSSKTSELEINGTVEPPPTPNDVTVASDLPDNEFFPGDQRRNSGASLNESISSSLSSGGQSTENNNNSPSTKPKSNIAKGVIVPRKATAGGGTAKSGRAGKEDSKASSGGSSRKNKNRFSHVTPRIDSGRQASGLKSPTSPTNDDQSEPEPAIEEAAMKEGAETEKETAPAPVKKRVHFQNCDSDKDEDVDGDAEEEFVIHPGPGFDESNGTADSQRVVNFQEPRSLVKQYIKGRSGIARCRPRIIRQTTVEVAELARRPQKATPIPQASASGAAPNIPVKQTIASKKRLEKLQQESQAQLDKLQADSAYMTPLQRKEALVKELRRQLGEAYYVIEQREVELDVFHHEKQREIQSVVEDKDDLLKELEESVEILQDELDATKADNNAMAERQTQLEENIKNLKEEAQKRELRHQNLYLQMYRKGRDSALFERQDELEKLALEEPDKVSKDELLKKLSDTQLELEHWQRVKLTEHYDEAAKPETEADAKLKFLKDSMFHYLTEAKKDPVEQHLNAIIQIFQFTDVQMKSINKALEEKRRRGKM